MSIRFKTWAANNSTKALDGENGMLIRNLRKSAMGLLVFGLGLSPVSAATGTAWLESTQNYIEDVAVKIEALRDSGDEVNAEITEVRALADLFEATLPTAAQMHGFASAGAGAIASLSGTLQDASIPLDALLALREQPAPHRSMLAYGQANAICAATVRQLLANYGFDALALMGDSFFLSHCTVMNPDDFLQGRAAPLYAMPDFNRAELECSGAGFDFVSSERSRVADSPEVACALLEAAGDPYALVPDPDYELPDPGIECIPADTFSENASSTSLEPCGLIDVINDPWSVIPDPGPDLPDCVSFDAVTSSMRSTSAADEALVCEIIRIINDPGSLIGDPGELIQVCEEGGTFETRQDLAVCEVLKQPPEYWVKLIGDYVKDLDPGGLVGPVGPPGGLPGACSGDPTGMSCLFESLGIKYIYITAGSTWYWLPAVPMPILLGSGDQGYTLIMASVEPTSEGVVSGGAKLKVEQAVYLAPVDTLVTSQGTINGGPLLMNSERGAGVVDYTAVGGNFTSSPLASSDPVDCQLSLTIEGGMQIDSGTTLYAGASASAFPRSLILGMSGSLASVAASVETVPGCAVHSVDLTLATIVDNLLGTALDYAQYYGSIAFRALGTTGSGDAQAAGVTDSPYGDSHPPAHNKAEMASGPFSHPPDGEFLTLYGGRHSASDIRVNLDLPLDVPRELKATLLGADAGALEVEVGATPPGYVRSSLDYNGREMIVGEVFGLTSEVRARFVAPELDGGNSDGSGTSAVGEFSFEAPDPIREITIGIPLIGSLGFSTGIWRVPETVTVCLAGTGACPNPGSKAHDIANAGSFRIETSEATYPYVSMVSSLGSVNIGIWLHKLGGYAGYIADPATAWAGFDTEKTEIGGGLGIADASGCAESGCGYLDAALLAWFDARQLVISERYPWFSLSGAHGCHSKSHISIAGKDIAAFRKLCGMLQFGDPGDVHGGADSSTPDGGTDLTVVGDIVLLGNPACQRANTHLEDAPLGYIPAGLIDGAGTTTGDYYYNPAQIVHQSIDPVYRVVCPAAAADGYDSDSPYMDNGEGGGYTEGDSGSVCVNTGNPSMSTPMQMESSCI